MSVTVRFAPSPTGNIHIGNARTALFRIDVVEIPLADPSRSRIIDSPAVFTDQDSGQIA